MNALFIKKNPTVITAFSTPFQVQLRHVISTTKIVQQYIWEKDANYSKMNANIQIKSCPKRQLLAFPLEVS